MAGNIHELPGGRTIFDDGHAHYIPECCLTCYHLLIEHPRGTPVCEKARILPTRKGTCSGRSPVEVTP